ncbi:MAG: hypothetical protein ACTSRG_26780, partial [Candidatus Helarchaeota archaeon]
MYLIFASNKVFVQFQITDYQGDSADLIIIYTNSANFSISKYLFKKKRKKVIKGNSVIDGKRYRQTILDSFFQPTLEKEVNPGIVIEGQAEESFLCSEANFGFIPLDKEGRSSWLEERKIDLYTIHKYSGSSQDFVGIIGKYISFRELLNEVQRIESGYTAGLIHQIYLNRLNILKQLRGLGLIKKFGFILKEYILTIYYLFFIKCNSFETFRSVNSREFAILIDNLSKPGPSSILKFLKSRITLEIAQKFQDYIYNYINHLDSDISIFLFFDEHLIPYQGRKRLAKGKSGIKNKVEKCFYRYYLTSPLFTCPVYGTFKDGSSRLEPEFFDILDEFETCTDRKCQVLIFDRGVKSPLTIKKVLDREMDFICWGVPFKEIEKTLKYRKKLKMRKISEKMEELIQTRTSSVQNDNLNSKEREIKRVLARFLPLPYLKKQYRTISVKEKKKKKWGAKEIIGIRDIDIEFDILGKTRTIVLETAIGKRMAIITSIKREIASAVEIVLILKKRQGIENFFRYKKAINGDHVFIWELEEKEVQKTRLGNIIDYPTQEELKSFKTKLKRANNKLEKFEIEYKKYKKKLDDKTVNKNTIKYILKRLESKIKLKVSLIKELKAFIQWGSQKKMPHYFDQFEKVMTPTFKTMKFINAINDLYFVISRQIAIDWASSLSIAYEQDNIVVKESRIEKISNMMPEKLNQILLNGSGKIYYDSSEKNGLIIELNCEYIYNGENLIAPYIMMLNNFDNQYKYCFDSDLKMKFTNRIERP